MHTLEFRFIDILLETSIHGRPWLKRFYFERINTVNTYEQRQLFQFNSVDFSWKDSLVDIDNRTYFLSVQVQLLDYLTLRRMTAMTNSANVRTVHYDQQCCGAIGCGIEKMTRGVGRSTNYSTRLQQSQNDDQTRVPSSQCRFDYCTEYSYVQC